MNWRATQFWPPGVSIKITAASIRIRITSRDRHNILRNSFRVSQLNKCKSRQTLALTQIQYQAFTLNFTYLLWSLFNWIKFKRSSALLICGHQKVKLRFPVHDRALTYKNQLNERWKISFFKLEVLLLYSLPMRFFGSLVSLLLKACSYATFMIQAWEILTEPPKVT